MIQALFDSKLLMFFILIMGIVVTTLMILFFIQNLQILTNVQQQLLPLANQTNSTANQTQLFLQQTKQDDERQERVNKLEMQGRSNQTRTIMNNTQDMLQVHHNGLVKLNDDLKKYIDKQNNTTMKLFREINSAQQQNQDIINILLDIQKGIQNDTKDTNVQVSKYGPENNALAKEILEILGGNSTEIIKKEVYSNQTLKQMILPSK